MDRIDVSQLDFIRMETRGRAVSEKFWVKHNDKYKLVKISEEGIDQDLIEYITSIILKKLGLDCVEVELGFDSLSNKNCCLVTNFLEDADVSYEFTEWKNVNGNDDYEHLEKCFKQIFQKFNNLYGITDENVKQLQISYIRTIFGKCIIENLDTKLENIGLIYNEKTNNYYLPSSFDNGMAFIDYNSFTEPLSCIGNQYFEMNMVIDYILDNYYEYVSDIFPLLDNLVNELELILSDIDIIQDKKNYIISYLNKLNNKFNYSKERNR